MTRMIFRRATVDDVSQIVDLAVESVSNNPIPVRISRAAMEETVRACLAPVHFCWVTEMAGKVVAAVVACAQPSFWFERMQCSVLLYWTKVKGAGLPLIREFVRWVKGRPAIKVAVIELEPSVDGRLVSFFKRAGFSRESLILSFVRGA